ncbi:hypothetical protein C8R46DRAFT_70518 [Mycena filopes]|nr:hypothetical protein C8R46DRAFT_70518 [Mycena filopes]
MASSSATPTTASSTPSSSPSAADRQNTGSNLYLYTFLITLLLLFTVTCGICGRAIHRRRRFRNRVDRARAQGLVLLPPQQGSAQLSFGAQPKLFDVWLTEKTDPSLSWADITPISVQPIPALYTPDWNASVASKLAPSTIASTAASTSSRETVQLAVLIAMPHPPTAVSGEREDDHDALPEVALGFTQSNYPS